MEIVGLVMPDAAYFVKPPALLAIEREVISV